MDLAAKMAVESTVYSRVSWGSCSKIRTNSVSKKESAKEKVIRAKNNHPRELLPISISFPVSTTL